MNWYLKKFFKGYNFTSVFVFIFDKLRFAHRLDFFFEKFATGANYVTENIVYTLMIDR